PTTTDHWPRTTDHGPLLLPIMALLPLSPGKEPAVSAESAPSPTALADDLQAFRNYIRSERGLAANTLLAYGRDLDRFAGWVVGGGLASYLAPSLRDLSHYLEYLRAEGLAPPSVARHLVALKMFYRFLRLEERIG